MKVRTRCESNFIREKKEGEIWFVNYICMDLIPSALKFQLLSLLHMPLQMSSGSCSVSSNLKSYSLFHTSLEFLVV